MRKCVTISFCCCALSLVAAEKNWTPDRILADSPWAKRVNAFIGTADEDARTYPVQQPTARDAGLGGRAVSDGNWDGGVGRIPSTTDPKLPVTVRWDSALPVREALVQSHAPEAHDSEHTIALPDKDYIITIVGLATAHPAEDRQVEVTQMRQGLMNQSRLIPKGKKSIAPEDARIDPATGTIQIFFPKTDPITLNDKEVTFGTVFGSIRVIQKFRLKEMTYKGKLEL